MNASVTIQNHYMIIVVLGRNI